MLKQNEIKPFLVIGSLPLPVGGVTIHVQRLLHHLKNNNIPFQFLDLRKDSGLKLIIAFLIKRKVHLHTSSVYLRFFVTLIGILTFKKIYLTLHGDLGRYNSWLLNYLDSLSLKMAYRPILLNKSSFEKTRKWNKRSLLRSAFFPPNPKKEVLDSATKTKILKLKSEKKYLFGTNAYNLAFDKNGNEIYGIFELIRIFQEKSDYGLIISDPSGVYSQEIIKRKIELPSNILLIPKFHSFYKVIELCDFTIRNTSTDGDSISVKESLYLEKGTICTDVVSRPSGTINYKRGHLNSILAQKNLAITKITSSSVKEDFNIEIQKTLSVYTE